MHGYNIGPYTALLAQGNGNGVSTASSPTAISVSVVSDAEDQGQQFVDDYRDTLTYLYGTYLQHMQRWSHNYLGLQFSAQAGVSHALYYVKDIQGIDYYQYYLPLNGLQNVPIVDAPEVE